MHAIENWLSIFSAIWETVKRAMKKMIKYSLHALVIAGCLLAAGCVRRTVTQGSAYTNNTKHRNPARGDSVIQEQTYWFWQGGFWSSEKK
jgi:hypothetical protein